MLTALLNFNFLHIVLFCFIIQLSLGLLAKKYSWVLIHSLTSAIVDPALIKNEASFNSTTLALNCCLWSLFLHLLPLFFFPLSAAFALTACHLVGTVSSWVRPHHPTSSALVWTSRPSPAPLHTSPRHRWDSCGCCRSTASQPLLNPNTSPTPAAQQILQAPQTAAKVDSCLQMQEERTRSVWTWWKNFRVWGCTEWLRGECPATAKQRDRSSQTSAEG